MVSRCLLWGARADVHGDEQVYRLLTARDAFRLCPSHLIVLVAMGDGWTRTRCYIRDWQQAAHRSGCKVRVADGIGGSFDVGGFRQILEMEVVQSLVSVAEEDREGIIPRLMFRAD